MELDASERQSIAEGYDLYLRAEPTAASLQKLGRQAIFTPRPKIDTIRYRAPKPFVRSSPQTPQPDPSKVKHIFADKDPDLEAEEILLDSN